METGKGVENTGPGSYEKYMALALDQAAAALDQGEFPVGCVIVQDGRVVARGARTGTRRTSAGRSFANRAIISEVDHAEIRALKQLEQSRQPVMPENCTLFCTMEPCLMCFAAILLSGIKTIVYAFEDPMGGGTGCDLTTLPPLYRNSRIRMVAGICRQKSLDLFFKFFNKGTSPYWKGSFLDRYVRDQMQKTE
jgi:tRNA(adenine34) deaminase